MGGYPDIKDKNFYKKINKKFNKFKIRKTNKTYDDWCYPKKYTLQMPQQFLSNFMNPNSPYCGLLVYHGIGSGKTCTSIQICEKFKKEKKIIYVLPASLRGNFRNELRSYCTSNTYITEKERETLSKLNPTDKKYIEIMNKTDERIDEYYEIYSYNKFVELLKSNSLKLKNTLLVLDEIQNGVSIDGNIYWTLKNAIDNAPKDLRVVLLSATPMYDKPSELALTLNLLRLPKEMPTGRDFYKTFIKATKKQDGTISYKMKNGDLFKSYIKGYISYYLGAPSFVFPKTRIKQVDVEMSDFQYSVYRKINKYEETYENELTNDFYIGTRMISNIVYPNKTLDEKGFKQFTHRIIRKDLEKYSCKFARIIDKIEHTTGKVFIYSNFKEYGGLASLIKVLEAFGYQSYMKAGVGKKRFAVWTGDESDIVKNEIRNVYNKKDNINGSKIKILLGSSSIKEGVSLTSVRQVHILENNWNLSRMMQIIGRSSRFCSHKDVDESKRSVKIYIYNAVAPYSKNKNGTVITIDEYMEKLAQSKHKLIMQFEKIIRESAIDCELNYNANIDDGNVDIVCDK